MARQPASQSQDFQSVLRQAQQARSRSDWPLYERLLRLASELGELGEGNRRALSWCIRMQDRPEDALEIANDNFARYPCVESCAEVGYCYADIGDYRQARAALRKIQAEGVNPRNNVIARGLLEQLTAKQYEFTWDVDLAAQRKMQQRGSMIFPVPFQSRPYQTAETTFGGVGGEFTALGENLFFRVDAAVTGRLLIKSKLTLIPESYRLAAKRANWDFPSSTKPYLESTANVHREDPTVQTLAKSLKALTFYQTVLNVMNWVNRNIKVKVDGPAGGSTKTIFDRQGGHCEARAAAGIALMRACGIPARFVRGNAFILEKNDISWHTVTEYYVPGVGWVTWDYGNPPMRSMALGYIATFSYRNSFDGPTYGDPDLSGPWGFQAQGLNCEFVKGRLLGEFLPKD